MNPRVFVYCLLFLIGQEGGRQIRNHQRLLLFSDANITSNQLSWERRKTSPFGAEI